MANTMKDLKELLGMSHEQKKLLARGRKIALKVDLLGTKPDTAENRAKLLYLDNELTKLDRKIADGYDKLLAMDNTPEQRAELEQEKAKLVQYMEDHKKEMERA